MKTFALAFTALLASSCAWAASAAQAISAGPLMYIGTLDKKLLVLDEEKEEVIDQIQLTGIPRVTALSADQKTLYIFTTRMMLEVVDLANRKVTGTFDLSDPRSRPRLVASAPDRINPGGSARFARFGRRPTRPLSIHHHACRHSRYRSIPH